MYQMKIFSHHMKTQSAAQLDGRHHLMTFLNELIALEESQTCSYLNCKFISRQQTTSKGEQTTQL